MSKREDILNSALELFAKEGYESVGIKRIVDSVSVTKPTLYHYFGSKQGLLEALLKEYYEPFLVQLEIKSEYSGDIVKTLENVASYCYNSAKQNKTIHNFIMILIHSPEDSEAGETSKPFTEKQHTILENMFKRASEDHGNMKGRSFFYSVSFWGVISSYITSYFKGRCKLDDQEVYQSCKQFMYGIFS